MERKPQCLASPAVDRGAAWAGRHGCLSSRGAGSRRWTGVRAMGTPRSVTAEGETASMDRGRCSRCDRRLPGAEFDVRDVARTRPQSYGRSCANAAWRSWYAIDQNGARYRKLVATRRKARIAWHGSIVRRAKSVPCADCGKRFPPEAMDFDHLGDKTLEISRLIVDAGTETLLAEIAKCEVVCANCHRIRTQARLRRGATGTPDEPVLE